MIKSNGIKLSHAVSFKVLAMRHFFCGVIAAESHLKSSQSEQMLHVYCVVPENIHTPTTGELEIMKGRGVQRHRRFQRELGLYDQFSFHRSFDSNYADLSVDLGVQQSFFTY